MTDPRDPMPTVRSILGDPVELDRERKRREDDEIHSARELIARRPEPVLDIAPPARRHAENAAELLDHAEEVIGTEQQRRREPDPQTLATMAQAEATLALVAQQRIANLIAWEDLTRESSRTTVRRELLQ